MEHQHIKAKVSVYLTDYHQKHVLEGGPEKEGFFYSSPPFGLPPLYLSSLLTGGRTLRFLFPIS